MGEDQGPPDTFFLLRKYKEEGDREALNRVFALHYQRVERIVRIRLGAPGRGRPEVANVIQDTMLRALENIDRFEIREHSRLVHWLAAIAERQVATLLRGKRTQKREQGRELELEAMRAASDSDGSGFDPRTSSTGVVQRVEKGEMEERVDRCLSKLPEHYREVILHREFEGGSWREVAEWMERPSEDSVRKLHERARAALGECVRRFTLG